MTDTVIKVHNLSKIYHLYDTHVDRLKETLHPFRKKYHHDFYALKDVNFEVKKGETIGIIGKNGSGKSTLLKILTKVLTPTSGGVEVRGRVSSLLELGAGFNPELTGLENVYFNGAIMGFTKDEIEAKLESILAFADIGDFIHQPVKTYSSGMQVRLAFAVVISVNPDILIVDEALAVGDISFQKKCYKRFENFKEEKKTILFVTHSTELVKIYCKRALLLEKGRIIQDNEPKEVVNNYLEFTRSLNNKQLIGCKKNHNKKKLNKNTEKLIQITDSVWYNKNEYKYGTKEAIITKIGLFNDEMESATDFEVCKNMIMVIKIRADQDIDQIFFSYGIRNLQGIDLFVFNGEPDYENLFIEKIKAGEEYIIKMKQKLNFVPGNYTMTLALSRRDADKSVYTEIRYDCLFLKVIGHERSYAGIFLDKNVDISILNEHDMVW